MNTWLNLSFQDSASFIMEQMIFFYDFSFLIISMILIFVVYMMGFLMIKTFTNRFLIDNQVLEFVWTVLPLIILVFMAFPSIRILYLMDEVKNPLVTCKVMGHQWFWSYEYSDFKNVEFDSYMVFNLIRLLEVDNFFVLPVSSKIRVIVSSYDVLHSWTIPSLGVKVDAVPGRLNQLNFVLNRLGVFYGQCSEICGANHSFMPVGLEVVSFLSFCNWLTSAE
uniref:Cytochrome c oxidase subunit 2 n=1 Tax=Pealius mori TaxID=1453199 RepID=A0A7G2CTC2_9HEMI|nr:cytochrome c oxidase subunit II [Pealius mori]WPM91813.1 cytochrome c oxidase subunit II [Pealius mori]CAD5105730.1 cytochrome c oxidase subunit 2 [Pealius mori]